MHPFGRPEKRRKVGSVAFRPEVIRPEVIRPETIRPEVIDIVKTPQGDLVIRAGGTVNGSLLRVHSAFLRMASPVFEAMLGGRFVESSTRYTAENPLCLTEDDGQAMLDLCTLLHHQYKMQDSLPLSRLPELVMLADKYQCLSTVRPLILSAMSQHFTTTIDDDNAEFDGLGLGLGNAMCIAYAVEDPRLFWRISRTVVVRTNTKNILTTIKRGLADLMPEGFVATLRQLQGYEHMQLLSALDKAGADLLKPVNLCAKSKYLFGEYNHRLYHSGLKRSSVTMADCVSLTAAYDTVKHCEEMRPSHI